MDTQQLADFLRARREVLSLQDVGLPTTSRRRTPGLRREEIVQPADTDLGVALVHNRFARAVFGDLTHLAGPTASVILGLR